MGEKATSLAHLFSTEGELAKHIKGFAARAPQVLMAEAVADALLNNHILLTEAGTGTGKTFAYLIPALLSGKKLLVSTGTKHLQEQLFGRDLPTLVKALKLPIQISLLKGRNNYLCLHRLKTVQESGLLSSLHMVSDLTKIARFKQYTQTGDIADIHEVAEDAAIWPYVTSTADNCLGQECEFFKECFINQARRKAQQAELVVINHHVFFADMALKNEGFGELLPSVDALIFDEAHQLAEVATQFLGTVFSSRQLLLLSQDIQTEYEQSVGDMADLPRLAQQVIHAVQEMRLALGESAQRKTWFEIKQQAAVYTAVKNLSKELEALNAVLAVAAPRSPGLNNCWRRCVILANQFKQLTGETPVDQIHWFETFSRSFSLHFTPLNLQSSLGQIIEEQAKPWIFTSATLTVNNQFEHFAQNLGLKNYIQQQVSSPFDYANQALLYVPRNLVDVQDPDYTLNTAAAMLPVLEASRGRAFYLFTSHRALQQAAAYLRERLKFPLLVQGDLPKTQLLNQFRQLKNAILLGNQSFWEGVDVRGEHLSCVIIEKLPFAVPDEPITKARIRQIKQQGGDPFYELQIPAAVIQLKQGTGRLIRDSQDRGVLVICDPRIIGRYYGSIFLKSLAAMPRTRELTDLINFFKQEEDTHEDISN